MLKVTHERDLTFAGGGFLAAASGLVVTADHFFVIADDDLHLGVFPRAGGEGTRRRVLPGRLPDDAKDRKARKPDFEALLRLPPFRGFEAGALLALGSGGTARRCRWVVLPLDDGESAGTSDLFDATALYARAREELPALNIEGAVVRGEDLILFHRGNNEHADNAVLAVQLGGVLDALSEGTPLSPRLLRTLTRVELGTVGGIPLGFTDAALLADGRVLFAASAEDTKDPYLDGRCTGGVLGVLATGLTVERTWALEGATKVEGIACANGRDVWMVEDLDDPSRPARLLHTTLPLS